MLWLLLLLAAGAPSLHDQADRAYRQKSYARACALYRQLAQGAPDDGAAWADLGLCLQKEGKPDEAVAANRRAARVGDGRTRLNAYYNLASLRATLPTPAARLDADGDATRPAAECAALAPAEGCAQGMAVCSRFEDQSGTGARVVRASLLFGADRAVVEAAAHSPRGSALRPGVAAIETASYVSNYCREQDLCGHDTCEDLPAADQPTCEQRFRARCDKAVNGCETDPVVTNTNCTVVFADACAGRVGLSCDGKARELSLRP